MKAKEYLQKIGNRIDNDAEDEIVKAMFEEAKTLAKTRKCQGGVDSDSSFGTYCDCFKEQFNKWEAVCRLRPEFYPERFIKLLHEEQELVFKMMASRRDFKEYLGNRRF